MQFPQVTTAVRSALSSRGHHQRTPSPLWPRDVSCRPHVDRLKPTLAAGVRHSLYSSGGMEYDVVRSYWLTLFNVETWEEFLAHGSRVAGFGEKSWKSLQRIKP